MPAMEGNKDEALRCFELAKRYIQAGHQEKAQRLLEKSMRLFPTEEAQRYLASLDRLFESRENRADDKADAVPPTSSAGASSQQHSPADGGPASEYTREQAEQVRKITSCRDYYEILGILKNATEVDIKKSYRRLALVLHPDKNKAPGASEAFKKVGKAFAVLSDSDKRRTYDQYGATEEELASQRQTRTRHRYSRTAYEFDEDEFDPDEIFRMFFGGGFPSSNVQRRSSHSHANVQEHSFGSLIQLAPLLILIFVSLFSSFLTPDPLFSLQRTTKYSEMHETLRLSVPFYVKKDFFIDKSRREIAEIERRVEDEALNSLRLQCVRERNYKEHMIWQARVYGNQRMYDEAKQISTGSCDQLEMYKRRAAAG